MGRVARGLAGIAAAAVTAAVLATTACGGARAGARDVEPTLMPGPPASAFDRAWAAVASGATRAARADGVVVERRPDGAIEARREIEPVAGGPRAGDEALAASVRARLREVPGRPGRGVTVDACDGEIHLGGVVEGREEAGDVVRAALDAPGVEVVVARLEWDEAAVPDEGPPQPRPSPPRNGTHGPAPIPTEIDPPTRQPPVRRPR